MTRNLYKRVLTGIAGLVLCGSVMAADPVTKIKLQTGVPSASVTAV